VSVERSRFDYLARLFAESGSRRALLHLVAALLGALSITALDDQRALAGRRRRKAQHRRHHRKRKTRCRARSKAQLCAGTCGTVKDRCKKKVNCGPCACNPPCPACQTCNNGSCLPDAEQLGNACGAELQACHDDGLCQECEVCASGCAFSSLQAAIDAADSGATITICPGAYSGAFTIGNDVTLAGAGDGADATSNTILDGQQQNTVITVNQGPTVTLRGLRIINGAALSGGGIANQGTLSVTGCTLTSNSAAQGGAAYNNGGTLTFTQSSISNHQ
jgi:hypothetical protein